MRISFKSPTKFEIESKGHKIISDQPKSAGGTDEGMEPVDLLLASLGSCIAVFVSHILMRRDIPLEKCTVSIDKEMVDNPRRVGKISVKLSLPGQLSESDRKAVMKAASLCTVHNTLHGHPEITMDFS
jgi:uncharacterized OsmC-like protein